MACMFPVEGSDAVARGPRGRSKRSSSDDTAHTGCTTAGRRAPGGRGDRLHSRPPLHYAESMQSIRRINRVGFSVLTRPGGAAP